MSKKSEKFNALLIEKHIINGKTTRDNFLGTGSTAGIYICINQFNYTSFEEAQSEKDKKHFERLWDFFLKEKCEIERRYNGHKKCCEDDNDDANSTCTHSSLTNSSSISAGTRNNGHNYEKIEEFFGIKIDLRAMEAHKHFD